MARSFSAIAKLWENKKPVDLITVAAECGGGLEDYLLECAEITPTAANADEYAAIVKRESCMRKVQSVGHDLVFTGDNYRDDILRSIERLTDIADDSSGDVIASKYGGGIAGRHVGGGTTMDGCTNNGNVYCTSTATTCGQIYGQNGATVTNCTENGTSGRYTE